MKIETQFNIGDTAYTIDSKTMKVTDFKVGRIGTYTCKDGKTTVTLYDEKDTYPSSYEQDKCFHTEAELMTFITKKDETL